MSRPLRLSPLLAWALIFTLGISAWTTPPAQAAPATTPASSAAEHLAVKPNPIPRTAACSPNPKGDLVGSFIANDRGQITNRSKVCTYEVGMASYRKFDNVIDHQQFFDA